MPLWSFKCRGCSATSELIRKSINRDNPGYCPTCLVWSMRRVITAPGLIGETVVREQAAAYEAPGA